MARPSPVPIILLPDLELCRTGADQATAQPLRERAFDGERNFPDFAVEGSEAKGIGRLFISTGHDNSGAAAHGLALIFAQGAVTNP
jgi:hypothetical protein